MITWIWTLFGMDYYVNADDSIQVELETFIRGYLDDEEDISILATYFLVNTSVLDDLCYTSLTEYIESFTTVESYIESIFTTIDSSIDFDTVDDTTLCDMELLDEQTFYDEIAYDLYIEILGCDAATDDDDDNDGIVDNEDICKDTMIMIQMVIMYLMVVMRFQPMRQKQ